MSVAKRVVEEKRDARTEAQVTRQRAQYGAGSQWGTPKDFIEVTLSRAQKDDFAALLDGDAADLWAHWQEMLLSGYKFSVVWNGKSQTHIVTVSTTQEDNPNVAGLLTARHYDAIKALLGAVYKHVYVVGERTWTEASGATGGDELS